MSERFQSRKLLDAAKDQSCVLCRCNNGTTVPAHLPGAYYGMPAGTGEKTHDWLVAHLCYDCHEKMDSQWRRDTQIRMKALCLTLDRLFQQGKLEVAKDARTPAQENY